VAGHPRRDQHELERRGRHRYNIAMHWDGYGFTIDDVRCWQRADLAASSP
jgi:hypothetical protein